MKRQTGQHVRLLSVSPRALFPAQALFGKTADSLERSTENEDEYMIHEREVTNPQPTTSKASGDIRPLF